MSTHPIVESGMTFGPFAEGTCFHIEKSACYTAIQDGVSMVEFLLLREQKDGPTAWIVEAKSSSPRPASEPSFSDYIDEIRRKLTHGFLLAIAAHLGRHAAADTELPTNFKAVDLPKLGFRFILVINGHQKDWLPPLKDALSLALKPLVKTWALPPTAVVVMNHQMAQECGLVIPSVAAPPASP